MAKKKSNRLGGAFTLRVDIQDDELLDKISYLTDKTKAELMREGAKKVIEDYKIILQRSQVML